MDKDLFGNDILKDELLRDKFIVPPFSIIDGRGGDFTKRNSLWKARGIKSEVGRNKNLIGFGNCNDYDYDYDYDYSLKEKDTSIFSPALTEIMLHWFCPNSGNVLDVFAGGSVRGIVAHYLDYKYSGLELRQEQVDSNREQAIDILPVENQPQWYCGDSDKLLDENWTKKFDFIFSCPPYADLEVYSELPEDLSNMDYKDFMVKYRSIIGKALKLLKKDCYAVFVVGEVRGKDGFYYDFVGDTKRAFIEQGAGLYNDMVFVSPVGTASLRCAKYMRNHKVAKVHQNILVFKKKF